ncbi:hypothetical protein RvY_15515 [Ramazzottius varieornatus]|uniref:RNA 2-O ribose methyltransferase substrate binding domain-containing protein n=1 Tax=Ramazzottius varieornatus TaxID=947166 RepID=A0A1D1VZU1_RAMVA|nr:hypothetical protein RvY_15515 [Ramazzottius varieornatus]
MSLGRLDRLRFVVRQFATSSTIYARGAPRYPKPIPEKKTYSEDDLAPQDFSQGKDAFAKPKREFSMEKFTQAVRGDRTPRRPGVSADAARSSSSKTLRRKTDSLGFEEDEETMEGLEGDRTAEPSARIGPKKDYDTSPINKRHSSERSTPKEAPTEDNEVPSKHQKKREPKRSGSSKRNETEGPRSRYPFLDDKNPIFKNTVNKVKNRTERLKHRRILLEGHRLVTEAVNNGVRIDSVFFSNPEALASVNEAELHAMKADIYHVSPKQMALWSDMTTAPGIMAVAHMPSPSVMDMRKQMPLTIVLDNIRDPNNMGAIVRVVAGAACTQIIAMKGCVDPWDGKVIRSAMGSHFHVPIHYNMEWELLNNYIDNPATVFLADNLEDRHSSVTLDLEGKQSPRLFPRKRDAQLETVPYHHVDFREGSVVLIIGGETHGVSPFAYSMTKERNGRKLIIPLGNYVESLNAASVVAVIAFEMRRQRLLLDDGISEDAEVYDPQPAPGLLQ